MNSDTSDRAALGVSAIPMVGTLSIRVRDAKTHRVKRRVTIKNKITYLAADVLVEMLAQRTGTDPAATTGRVYSMRMGTANTPAARTDTNLGAFSIGVQITDVNKVSGASGEITFIATLESGDANGVTLREAGLFTAGTAPATNNAPGTTPGTTRMIARQIYPDIAKTSSVVIDYSWTISFTAP